jgi:hypothetical protein
LAADLAEMMGHRDGIADWHDQRRLPNGLSLAGTRSRGGRARWPLGHP